MKKTEKQVGMKMHEKCDTLKSFIEPKKVFLISIGMKWNKKQYRKIRGAYDKFPDFFRMGTFIDSTHMKL